MNDFVILYYCFCLSLFEVFFLWENDGLVLDVMIVCFVKRDYLCNKYYIIFVRMGVINKNEVKIF